MYDYAPETRAALEGLKQPLAVYQLVDGQPVLLILSDGFCSLYEFPDREQAAHFLQHGMYSNLHPEDRALLSDAALQFFQQADAAFDVSFRIRIGASPEYRVVHARGTHVWAEDGSHLVHVWYMDEGPCGEDGIAGGAEEAAEEERILHSVHYDELTGLPSMTWFFKLSTIWKERVCGAGKHATLLYIDFNGMKLFNQKYGFGEGDRLLKAFAGVLTRIFGKENCCHITADHFGVFSSEDALEAQLQRLFRETEGINDGRTLPLRVGVYSTSIEDVPVSIAYDRASMASREIRQSTVSEANYFNRELLETIRRKQYIIANIDRAIAEGWIQVYYQPIVRAVNEKICDEEALARWIDPEQGFLSPGEFIPELEEAGLIYRLDLCVLDQVLEKFRQQLAAGMEIVPTSINLSRSDFSACDIVEEIRKRVDAAGIPHTKITIEITESILGSDQEFMKDRILRFRELGFPVWIDDFGSGYSSFDLLLTIPFDLVKLDMSFMRKLDESRGTRVVLTELMKMATALNIDTVCEGVETESQVRFLQEIGCSKLQGYYFAKPMPVEMIVRRYNAGLRIGFEDVREAAYYETMGRVNLYDLGTMADEDDETFQKAFSMVPMGVIEVKGDAARFVRSNPSYRDFMKRSFGIDLSAMTHEVIRYQSDFMRNLVKTCAGQGAMSFYDEKMSDGSMVHSLARRIAVNPLSGDMAVVVAILSVTDPGEGETYADIARALAADYYNIYVVDLDNDEYIEYTSSVGGEELAVKRHGEDFFASSVRDTMTRIYQEDQERFLKWFTKQNIVRELGEQGVFTITYRLIDSGVPVYVNMKINRMQGTNRIILGVSVVDSQMKQQEHMENVLRERAALARMMAITEDYYILYSVDSETDHYVEYTAAPDIERLGIAKEGADFFRNTVENTRKLICPEDLDFFLQKFTKQNVLEAIRKDGKFIMPYRLMLQGAVQPVFLKIVSFHDGKVDKLLVSVRKWCQRS